MPTDVPDGIEASSADTGVAASREAGTGTVPVRRVEDAPEREIDGVPLYDLRGLQCPLPVLKTGHRMRGMAAGARLWVETTDPLAVIDVPAFARENAHELVESHEVEGGYRFLLERGTG